MLLQFYAHSGILNIHSKLTSFVDTIIIINFKPSFSNSFNIKMSKNTQSMYRIILCTANGTPSFTLNAILSGKTVYN